MRHGVTYAQGRSARHGGRRPDRDTGPRRRARHGGPGRLRHGTAAGRLVDADGTLAVEAVPGGPVTRVEWPFGYGVGEEAGTLTLTRVFMTVAREGDLVSMGGGEGGPGFRACGPVTLGLILPPEAPRVGVGLTVTGTAYEPCIPPPSGCGYWVSIGAPGGATWRAPLDHDRTYESAVSGDPAPLTVGDGLPASLAPGGYDLVLEVGEYSDAATPEPLDDGTLG